VSEAAAPGTTSGPADRLHAGDIVLDRAAHLVTVRGHSLTLAMQEFRLLELLMENADHVVPSSAILVSLWGAEFHGDPGTIAVHVLRLRKKLERWPGASRHLRTVRGLGYVFDTEPVED
jgi:two-component system response regulator RegX3